MAKKKVPEFLPENRDKLLNSRKEVVRVVVNSPRMHGKVTSAKVDKVRFLLSRALYSVSALAATVTCDEAAMDKVTAVQGLVEQAISELNSIK